MVNGPGSVILASLPVLRRRNCMSRTSTGVAAAHLADRARHHGVAAGAVPHHRRRVDVDAVERGREAVGIALAPHLAVGDDVDAGALHVADRDQGRVVLRLFEERLRHAPHLLQAHARHGLRLQHGVIDQPVGLRIGADHGRRQQWCGHAANLTLLFAHDLIRKPLHIPDQVRDRLFGIMRRRSPSIRHRSRRVAAWAAAHRNDQPGCSSRSAVTSTSRFAVVM